MVHCLLYLQIRDTAVFDSMSFRVFQQICSINYVIHIKIKFSYLHLQIKGFFHNNVIFAFKKCFL